MQRVPLLRVTCGLWLLIVLAVVQPADAAFDAFLKIDGIPGESTGAAHPEWCDVRRFELSVQRAATNMPPRFGSLKILKPLDKASPILNLRCADQQLIPDAGLEFVTTGENRVRFYQVTLEQVRIVHVSSRIEPGDNAVIEELQLAFDRVSWTYTEFDNQGQEVAEHSAYWDIVRNQGGGGLARAFRVSAVLDGDRIVLTWPAEAQKTYDILGSRTVDGAYEFVQRLTASETGPMTAAYPASLQSHFFLVKENP